MPRKRTTEDIVAAIGDRPIRLLSEYKTISAKVDWECKVCSHAWSANCDNVINKGSGCPKCGRVVSGNKQKKTQEQLVKELQEKPLEMVGEYVSYDVPTLWKCKQCDHHWKARPNNVISKSSGCPPCSEHLAGKVKSESKRLEMMDIMARAGIRLVSPYTKIINHHDLECTKCNYKWNALLSSIKYNRAGCPACAGSIKLTNEIVDEKLKKLNKGIVRLGNVINATCKIEWKCSEGHCWSAVPDSVVNGLSGCAQCNRRGMLYRNLRANATTRNTPCTFYVVRFDNGSTSFLKIGLTLRSVRHRFVGYPYTSYNVTVLKTAILGVDVAVKEEQGLLKLLDKFRQTPTEVEFGGKTECFRDVPEVHEILKEHKLQ